MKSVCHKWHSPAMESRAHWELLEERRKQTNPSRIEIEKSIRKEGMAKERAWIKILNLQSSRNSGWHQYPRDQIWRKRLSFLAFGGYPSQRAGFSMSVKKILSGNGLCRSDADSTHSKLRGTGSFPLLSWGWRGVPKLLKLPEMEPRGTLGKDMTIPARPCICLRTCEKPTASHRHDHYHHDDHRHCCHCHRYL